MTAPCQAGQSCPQIEQAELRIQLKVTGIIQAEFRPILEKMHTTSESMAVHAERLRVGSEQFADQEKRLKAVESWKDTREGQDQAAEKAGRRAGFWWGVGSGLVGFALQAFYHLTGSGKG